MFSGTSLLPVHHSPGLAHCLSGLCCAVGSMAGLSCPPTTPSQHPLTSCSQPQAPPLRLCGGIPAPGPTFGTVGCPAPGSTSVTMWGCPAPGPTSVTMWGCPAPGSTCGTAWEEASSPDCHCPPFPLLLRSQCISHTLRWLFPSRFQSMPLSDTISQLKHMKSSLYFAVLERRKAEIAGRKQKQKPRLPSPLLFDIITFHRLQAPSCPEPSGRR